MILSFIEKCTEIEACGVWRRELSIDDLKISNH